MKYFLSDTHFGDNRLQLFGRDLIANTSEDIDNIIIDNYNRKITKDDTVYFIGDISYTQEGLEKMKYLMKGTKILIRGNYDQQFTKKKLLEYFDEVHDDLVVEIKDNKFYLNHYPTNCKKDMFNICGHIHGLWKVQRNMINVGVDAWHFMPVSEEQIIFYMNGIKKHYDANVFAGELEPNNVKQDIIVDKHKFQLNWVKEESIDNLWSTEDEILEVEQDKDEYKIMETKEIVELMLKSSDHNPYTGMLSKKDNLIAAIDLAKLCKDFADKGQTDEAMNILSEEWAVVISELEGMLLNCA